MKKNFTKKLMALILIGVMVLGLAACGSTNNGTDESKESVAQTESKADSESKETKSEEEAEAEKPAVSETVTKDTPFVIGTSTLDGKFSEFFHTSAYDRYVVELTSMYLLASDKNAEPIANDEKPSYAQSFTTEVADDNSSTVYTFVLKNDAVFSDGTPVTIDDLLFNFYVYSDPYYDGSSTIYALDIDGLAEYRLQTSTEMVEVGDDILAAGISGEAGEDPVLGSGLTVATAEQQQQFWAYLDEAGANFAQEITDFVVNNYLNDDYVESALPGFTVDEVKSSETLQTAFGMAMWGFGELEDKTFTDGSGNEYDLSDATTTLDGNVYWQNLVDAYGYDLEGLNGEQAGEKNVEDYVADLFYQNEGSVAGGVASITGITTSTVTGDDGEEHDALVVTLNGIDPTAIFKLAGIPISPKAYYSEGYEGEVNEFGVNPNNADFMTFLKTKNDNPVGAGPYIFDSYKDNVVTMKANPNFILGEPKIPVVRFQVLEQGSELDALKTGTVHFAEPSASQQIVSDISSGSGDYSKLDYILVDNDGYGYIGINSQAIPDWNVRKALAHSFDIESAVENYYGELASVNNRTMTKVQWAYPDNPEALYPFDETGETSKQLLLDAGYVYDEAENEMQYPADHEKAGQQLTVKFTLPSEAKDHPAGQIFINSQKLLETIGVKVDIEVDENLLSKLTTAYESGIQVWAAAWGSGGADPDMFQIWYSDPTVNTGGSPNNTGLYWLFQNGSDDQKAVLTELNENINAGRSILDPEERKPIYGKALELSTSLAVEIPTYQRKNMFAYNKDVVNGDTLFSGEDVTPFQSPRAEIWNVELNW